MTEPTRGGKPQKKPEKRRVRVLPVAWPDDPPAGDIGGNVDRARRLLDRVEPGSADLVCLPEGFLSQRVPAGEDALVETFASWARTWNAWFFVPMLRSRGELTSNDVLVFDRAGRLAGSYAKLHPWPSTPDLSVLESGVTPGHRAVPVPTEFGPVGVQTCFDVNWSGGWRELQAQGCKLIVFPSEYPGGFALRVRAWQTRTPVVAAVLRGRSRVVDLTGEVLGAGDFPAAVELNLNRCLVHLDHAWPRIRRLTDRDPAIRVRRLPDDNVVVLSAPPDGPPIEDTLRDAGIRPLDTYLRRAKEAIDASRRHVRRVGGRTQLCAEPRPVGP